MRTPSAALALLLAAAAGWAANVSKPHPHQGILKPYTQLPPARLDPADLASLRAGKPIRRQTDTGAGGRGVAIFRVNAPADTVWATINNFQSYPKWIDNLSKCAVYKREGDAIDVEFVIKGFGFSARYFIHHTYHQAERWGTWTLDYTRESDLDDSVGFWRVTPWAENPAQSVVEYSVDVQVRGWIPGFVRGLFVDKGLQQATEWVKIQSEAAHTPR